MHIPDGFLDLKTAATSAGLSLPAFWVALKRLQRTLPRRRVPLLGLAAAFVFAAQMLNFPVAGGTSGHLMGGVLVAILLGPSAALLVLTAVLLVQCLLFADGGVLAFGANLLNMAVVDVLGGYTVFVGLRHLLPNRRGLLVATAFSAWAGIVFASMSCAVQLAAAGVAPWGLVFPAMVNIHILIGVGEGLITTLVVLAIAQAQPDLLPSCKRDTTPSPLRHLIAYGLALTVALVVFVAPFASKAPDGLERVAATLGFAHHTVPSLLPAPMSDYQIPGIGSALVATGVTGFLGTVLVFALAHLLALRLLKPPLPQAGGAPRL